MAIRKSASLKEQAYMAIREAIVSKKIHRGLIYSEKWFADNFQVSRTPVREALLQLRSEGMIEVLPNRGITVKNLTAQDARNIFQIRGAIEGYCSSYLARHNTEPEGKKVLKEIGEALERCRSDFNREDEMLIHEATLRFVDNPFFIAQHENMSAMVEVFWWDVIGRENRREEVYWEHRRIYDAMCAGDEKAAYDACQEHCRITLQKITETAVFDEPEELKIADASLRIER